MCKHILNSKVKTNLLHWININTQTVQVFVQAPCCNGWYECPECHDEVESHPMAFSKIIRMTCKSCTRCFDRDLTLFTEGDKCCSNCGVLWCIPGLKTSIRHLLCQQFFFSGVTTESRACEESLAIISSCMSALTHPAHDNFNAAR
jgi:uncharacterized CHY-type Zn-finger protein